MKLDEYLAYVAQGEIPPEPPDQGVGREDFTDWAMDQLMFRSDARDKCTKAGMWTVVDRVWTAVLAAWIGDRSVLEIMSGAGWLAKALSQHGVKITATDNFSWKHGGLVYPVQEIDAVEAVRTIEADILLISWPPYGDEAICNACEAWGNQKSIVYIGEGEGGCNAPDKFFERFEAIDLHPSVPLKTWMGIDDFVQIGKWS